MASLPPAPVSPHSAELSPPPAFGVPTPTDPGEPVRAEPPGPVEPVTGAGPVVLVRAAAAAPPADTEPRRAAWAEPAAQAVRSLGPPIPASPPGPNRPRPPDQAPARRQSGWVEPPPRAAEPPTGPLPPVTGPPPGGSADFRPGWRSRMVPALIGLLILGVAGTGLAIAHRSRHGITPRAAAPRWPRPAA